TGTGAPTIPVNGTDVAANSSGATTLTLTLDNTAPGGGVMSGTAPVRTPSVRNTPTLSTDGSSGLAAGTNTISRSAGQAVTPNPATAVAAFAVLACCAAVCAHILEPPPPPAGDPLSLHDALPISTGTGAPTIPVNATDVATNSSGATTLTLTLDNTAPGGGV